MSDETKARAKRKAGRGAVYSHQQNPAFEAWMAQRTAAREAAFFLPHLRPGMRLADLGCGPGTITQGLAEAVAPGRVIGMDFQPSQVARAQALTRERGVANVCCAAGDANRLPFASQPFDAVFAHGVLMHMSKPLEVLMEVRRVLRPGGFVGVRDPDLGAGVLTPQTPLLERAKELRIRVRQHNGSDPFVPRDYRRLLLNAGFERATATASVEFAGSAEETRGAAAWMIDQHRGLSRTALAQGWVTQSEVDAIAAEIEAWGERPDAFTATLWCEAIGWVKR